MHEDLLGYLLGALEPHEMHRVSQWLRDDPQARRELAELERALKPLEENYQAVEPPPANLVARTLANLPSGGVAVSNSGRSDDVVDSPAVAELVRMHDAVDAVPSPAMTWMDWAGGAIAVAVLLGMLLPSIAQGRFEARKRACQDHLRQLGIALTQYVIQDEQQRLPAVADEGPEACAGVYASRLFDAGLLTDSTLRWCPSLDLPSYRESAPSSWQDLVSVSELRRAPVDRLRQFQQFIGGHYAYSLGVIEQNRFRPPRFEARSSFAVMSDAPMIGMSGGEVSSDRIGHSGTGINVLYEDGRTQFLRLGALGSIPDHPLFNHRGRVEAGVNVDDASLAPSWRPPFVNVRQR